MALYPEYLALIRHLASDQTAESRRLPYDAAPDLIDLLYSHAPSQGERGEAYTVVVPPGKSIAPHDHVEDVVLYYVEPADTPVEIDGTWYLPVPGEVLVVPARVRHSVARNSTSTTRISVALKVRVQ